MKVPIGTAAEVPEKAKEAGLRAILVHHVIPWPACRGLPHTAV